MPSKSEHEVTLKQVADSSSPLFELCLGILRESIPPSEQLGDRRLKKLLARDDYRIYALLLNETVAATAILYLPKTSRFVLLDYMGVRLDLRGRGVGSTLFRELVKITSRERPAAGYLIFEVDDDREDFSHADSVNHRRIDFYHRLGAQLLSNANYFFPKPNRARSPDAFDGLPIAFGNKADAKYRQRGGGEYLSRNSRSPKERSAFAVDSRSLAFSSDFRIARGLARRNANRQLVKLRSLTPE